MNKTQIEWALNPDGTPGYTWNPITGCLNGCPYCYARKLANTRLKERYLANRNVASYDSITEVAATAVGYSPYHDPFYPRFWEDKLYGYSLTNSWTSKPKGIFVCDMSDLFGIGVPEEWTREVLEKISQGRYSQHRFYLLTKQPQKLQKFSPFPDNCWVGVTATDRMAFNRAVGNLAKVKAKIRFISFEPLLERMNHESLPYLQAVLKEGHIQWVIIGSQTKPLKHPKTEWVKEIVEACGKAKIPVFLKNTIAGAVHPDMDWAWHGANLRQEVPSENNSSITGVK